MLLKSTPSLDTVAFAADTAQLDELLRAAPRGTLVLCGEASLASLQPRQDLEGYSALPPRPLARVLPWRAQPAQQLYIWVQRESLDKLSRSGVRVAHAADALALYARSLKRSEEALVVAAFAATGSSVVTVMHVRKGLPQSLADYALGACDAHTWEADLHLLAERLQSEHPQAILHWAGPLPRPKALRAVDAGASLWAGAPAARLGLSSAQLVLRRHGLSAALVVLTLGLSAGALYLPYQRYEQARQSLEREMAGTGTGAEFATDRLRLLEARRTFLQQTAGTQRLQSFEQVLLAAGAQPDVRVLRARLLWSSEQDASGRSFDFELELQVPAMEGTTALEQALPLLRALSAELGMTLRLAPGVSPRGAAAGGRGEGPAVRIYTVLGELARG
jgi:hypothetical protein